MNDQEKITSQFEQEIDLHELSERQKFYKKHKERFGAMNWNKLFLSLNRKFNL